MLLRNFVGSRRYFFILSTNGERFYYLCDAKPRQFSIRCEVLNKDALKSKILPHLSVAKSGYTLKDYREKVIHNILNMPENKLSMADYCYLCKI